jgi:translation elongation factor EF-Tu-like GTPase
MYSRLLVAVLLLQGVSKTGVVHTGDELQLIGLGAEGRKTVCTGVEMSAKFLTMVSW